MTLHPIKVRHKGQITLPATLRKELDIDEGDDLLIQRRGKELVIVLPDHVVDPTAGALAKYPRKLPPMTPEEMSKAAVEAIVEENIETLRQIERDHEGR